jgi:hypothetical protein
VWLKRKTSNIELPTSNFQHRTSNSQGALPRTVLELDGVVVLSLANLASANNLHSAPKARMFPGHTDGWTSVDYLLDTDGVQTL